MKKALRIIGLFVILTAYSGYLLYIGMQNKKLDYMEKMMYKIVQDTYFIGCAEHTQDFEKCRIDAGRFRDQFETTLEGMKLR